MAINTLLPGFAVSCVVHQFGLLKSKENCRKRRPMCGVCQPEESGASTGS